MPTKLVIIGGVAGGATAACKARRTDEFAEITIYERGKYISFANCGLPMYISGEIQERQKLLLQSPESLKARFNVDVKVEHEVISIDRKKKEVKVKNLVTGEIFSDRYDKLIIATGAGAIVPSVIEGIHSKNIFVVKTVPDSDNIKSFIQSNPAPKNAVIVGAGFIGLEMAEALKRLNLNVTIVEMLNQVLPPFDVDIARMIESHIISQGIQLILGDGVKSFKTQNGFAKSVELQSGKLVPCDFVILSIGVAPETKLAKEAGLEIGITRGIKVNEYMQTSDPDIYAVGDVVETTNLITGAPTRYALAGPANKQGRAAGKNALTDKNKIKFIGAYGTSIVRILGFDAGMTGLTEKECIKSKIPYRVTLVKITSIPTLTFIDSQQ